MNRIFVFGAGASLHAGAPLGNNFLNKYVEILNSKRKDDILYQDDLLSRILEIQPNQRHFAGDSLLEIQNSNLPNIEDIFTLFDIAYEKEESLLYESEGDRTIIRREDFFFLIRETICKSIEKSLNDDGTTVPYLSFVKKLNKNDTIISFNYDTLIDNAVKAIFQDLNYGFDFTPMKDFIELIGYNWKTVVQECRCKNSDINLSFNSDEVPLILKPHGSLNWLYCSKCYNYYYLPGTNLIFYPPYFYECPNSFGENPLRRVRLVENIIPLTHLKNFKNPIFNLIWLNIIQRLSKAEVIYFIGYSLPDVDFISKYYFIKGLNRVDFESNVKITVINPNIKEEGLDIKFKKLFGSKKGTIDFEKLKFKDWVISL